MRALCSMMTLNLFIEYRHLGLAFKGFVIMHFSSVYTLVYTVKRSAMPFYLFFNLSRSRC
ncbi:Uncharacterised protein [Serratia fonticola]|nr:Uncharacterised protein [Serratia fonticola]